MKSLSEQSDEMLCRLAASGDPAAEECLAARYNRLVRICARPYFLAGGDSEDLIQEGMIGLLSAIRGYLTGRETSFQTYAEICIQNRLRSAVRAAVRDKHTPLNQSVSLSDPLGEDEGAALYGARQGQAADPEDVLIGKEEQEERMKALRGKLSPLERKVLDLYLSGLSYGEIARQMNKPLKSVDNAVQRIRRKAAPVLASGDFSES